MLLSQMLADLPVEVVRDADVRGFGALNAEREGLLHYFSDPKFEHQLTAQSGLRSILTTPDLRDRIPEGFGLALCEKPKEIFLKAVVAHSAELEAPPRFANEISPSARIHPRAVIGEHSIRIGANVVIGPNAVIQERVEIEDDVHIGANSVIGGDGFEVGMADGRQKVVPHFGTVRIRRGAVIQSGCTVDWGLYGGCTDIGEDTALDNLVHVAHNVRIGRNCQLIACVFIGGSSVIEDGARIGPNATISNGLTIGKDARVTIGAVVTRNVEDGGHVTGNFAIPHRQFLDNLRKAR